MEQLFFEMFKFFAGNPQQIQHLVKVHSFSRLIGLGEKLDTETQEVLEIAAIVHDIGIKPSLEKYGSALGTQQELEGPPIAKEMLESLGYSQKIIDRVCFLVGHHHTYSDIDGLDYQILVEADFLVNIFEGKMSDSAAKATLKNIFKTASGIEYFRLMFNID